MPLRLSRRQTLVGTGLLLAAPSVAQESPLRPALAVGNLRTNQMENPTTVHDQAVRLAWQIQSDAQNTLQTAWRVTACSTRDGLLAGRADIWDSGRNDNDRSFDIQVNGQKLHARQRVWWRVQIWDSHGRTAISEPAFWEMGLLSPDDWTAQWLAVESATQRGDREAGVLWVTSPQKLTVPTAQIRLAFSLDSAATLSILSAAGTSYSLFVDGAPVNLPPWPPTSFGKQGVVESSLPLDAGPHMLALRVAVPSSGFPECAFLLRITYADGRIERFNALTARISGDTPDHWNEVSFNANGWPLVSRIEHRKQSLPGAGAYLLRRTFKTSGTIRSARLFTTALGACVVFLNGRRVGDDVISPESMDFRKRIRYRAYDVTTQVVNGANAIGAIVGDGWYGSYTAPLGRFAFGEPPLRFIAQLEVTYTDGHVETIQTDSHWKISLAPITASEIYNGEHYDARLEQPGWDMATFTEGAGWSPAAILPPESGLANLIGADSPPIRRIKTLSARSVKAVNENYVVDFGQNFAGWVRIHVKGPRGQTVTLKFAETLKPDGSVDQANLRAANSTDVYILKGDPKGETWEPYFTYHGFRYVEVSGLRQPLAKAAVTGVVVHSHLPETGRLVIGNPLLQQFWQNSYWSQRSNFMGIPTDCPQRDERLGWLGDANVFWDAASFNMDVGAFTNRWMADIRDAQYASGAFAFIAPNSMPDVGTNEASPGWADAGVMLPWTAWKRYGDTAVIDQNWEAMSRYIRYIQSQSDGHIWARGHGWDFGDWLALDAVSPGDPTTPKDLIGTAMYKGSVDALADMALATGRVEAAEQLKALSRNIRAAFVDSFIKSDGTIGNDSQTSYILALAHDLVPDHLKKASAEKLRANIVRRGNLLTTGFLGTPASLDVLADNGFAQTVYDLLLRTEYPSWGYMVIKGATTTWERWNGDTGDITMNSFNHYALGAVVGFIFRRIAGIDPVEPGFRVFRVNPLLDTRLAAGGGSYNSVVGLISTRWSRHGQLFSLDVNVPPNSTALVHLPTGDLAGVMESGLALTDKTEFKQVEQKATQIVLSVGSGTYRFTVRAGSGSSATAP
ncbi:alpha-L-rhamnosidase [Niveispirillum lacus]|uniref:alpha-L-rhamnosidase n=1 Tax=Niveispirillum lacus TaxID=1981099 RepID=A0A255Z1L2_9PROT|nr:alpha-L-rhamnosidase [Niveispirillum lacus]OYQ35342.1 alpha-L-rhamnosidase [Niveispirillum lacus]